MIVYTDDDDDDVDEEDEEDEEEGGRKRACVCVCVQYICIRSFPPPRGGVEAPPLSLSLLVRSFSSLSPRKHGARSSSPRLLSLSSLFLPFFFLAFFLSLARTRTPTPRTNERTNGIIYCSHDEPGDDDDATATAKQHRFGIDDDTGKLSYYVS